ncbi:MAG: hypothetical protein KGJ90_06810 [Patescibacteria group bacterium]|nr:hypothetical protein [Patescibacteria group bacterium]
MITRTSVLWLKDSDSHTDIIDHYKLRDDGKVPDFVKVEIVPSGNSWMDMSKWGFFVDQDVLPAWFNPVQDEHRARLALEKRFPRWKGNIKMGGDLYLRSLTSLPDNAKLSAGGDLDLSSLTGDIPKGVIIKGRVVR